MNVIDIYTKKEYTCKKCNGQVYYGKVTASDGTLVTKDGQNPNGKFGKESNVLSAAVDVNNKEKFHECYSSNVEKQYNEAMKLKQPLVQQDTTNSFTTNPGDEFDVIANRAYQKLYILASKFCGADATAKDKHITTMGLMHDYFQFRTSKGI
jgi:hypothetical protein